MFNFAYVLLIANGLTLPFNCKKTQGEAKLISFVVGWEKIAEKYSSSKQNSLQYLYF